MSRDWLPPEEDETEGVDPEQEEGRDPGRHFDGLRFARSEPEDSEVLALRDLPRLELVRLAAQEAKLEFSTARNALAYETGTYYTLFRVNWLARLYVMVSLSSSSLDVGEFFHCARQGAHDFTLLQASEVVRFALDEEPSPSSARFEALRLDLVKDAMRERSFDLPLGYAIEALLDNQLQIVGNWDGVLQVQAVFMEFDPMDRVLLLVATSKDMTKEEKAAAFLISHVELARIFGMKTEAMYKRIDRVRKKLQKRLPRDLAWMSERLSEDG